MPYLLDTNVAIHVRDRDTLIVDRLAALDGPVFLSIVSRVELEGGVNRDPATAHLRRARLTAIVEELIILPFADADADVYRSIIQAAGYSRRKVLDRMIAAQALVQRATLVTLNGDDFRDVPGLELLEW